MDDSFFPLLIEIKEGKLPNKTVSRIIAQTIEDIPTGTPFTVIKTNYNEPCAMELECC